jgi:PIN domain nuclease of toxin-antitoxin system
LDGLSCRVLLSDTEWLESYSLQPIEIAMRHVLETGLLPLYHNDPFDRLLLAQAQTEGFTIVSPDPAFSRYAVDLLW